MLSHFSRTRKGHQELKTRTHKLTARQRALLLIIENVQWNDTDPVSVQQLSTADNVKRLLELQLIEAVNDSAIGSATTVEETPAVEAMLQPMHPPATADLVPGRYKVILTALAPKKPFGTLYDFISLPTPAAPEVSQQASPIHADAGLAEEAARKSVFLSYLPYLGGKKKPAQEAAADATVAAPLEHTNEPLAETQVPQQVLADAAEAAVAIAEVQLDAELEGADAELATTDSVQAVADEQAVVEEAAVDNSVAENAVQNLTVAANLQTDSEPLMVVTEPEPVAEAVSSVEVASLVEVGVVQAEIVEACTDTAVVSVQPATDELATAEPETTDAVLAVEALSSIEADAELADTNAEALALEEEVCVVQEAEVLASETLQPAVLADAEPEVQQTADDVPVLDVATADSNVFVDDCDAIAAQQDVQAEAAEQVGSTDAVVEVQADTVVDADPVVTVAEAPVAEVAVTQPFSVISTLTVNTRQALSTADFTNSSHSLADVQMQVVAEGPHADGMLYIADHNKKWQERHIPLLVWTVTMPGTKKQQKKLELPLKLYNVDEFEQVWDAKPPYGSH